MSYDDTSFYGDMIVDEYDDKCNFIGTNTPMGYLAYHLLGDGFDLMSELCSKFMNDFNILTADTRGLDKFWGVSYNLPRPLLYEGQKADYLFIDNGTTASHNNNWNNPQYITRTDTGTIINNTRDVAVFETVYLNGSTLPFTNEDFTVEFEIVENNYSTTKFRFDGQTLCDGETYRQFDFSFAQNETGRFKFIYDKDINTIAKYKNGTYVETYTHHFCGKMGLLFRLESGASIKYKDFKVYKGEEKERPLNDDEYKIYLYLRNCRLITKEDLLINFNKCFGFDDYPIVFSDETFYLEATDHLNYEPTDTVSSNLHKNSEDTTLHFVTDYSNDETTETIESGLSTEEELVTVINIPYNNWDNEFLEMLEQYISIKGNIKIKEYTL